MISACAIARRCCMPPDSCCGYLSSECAEADAFAASRPPRPAPHGGAHRTSRPVNFACGSSSPSSDVAHHAQVLEHRVALKHHAAMRVRLSRQAACRRAGSRRASRVPGRATGAGMWTCRSPTRRPSNRIRLRRCSGSSRSSTTWSPYSFQTLRTSNHRAPPPYQGNAHCVRRRRLRRSAMRAA